MRPIKPIGSHSATPSFRAKRLLSMRTEVDDAYDKNLLEGMSEKDAAKLAQEQTGLSIVTGKRMKTKGYL